MKKRLLILLTIILTMLMGTLNVLAEPGGKGNIAEDSDTQDQWTWFGDEKGHDKGHYSSYEDAKNKAFIIPKNYISALKATSETKYKILDTSILLSSSEAYSRYHDITKRFDKSFDDFDWQTGISTGFEHGGRWFAADPVVNDLDNKLGFTATNCVIRQLDTETGKTVRVPVDVKVTVTKVTNRTEPLLSSWKTDGKHKGKEMVALRLDPTPALDTYGISDVTVKMEFFEADGKFKTKKEIATNLTFNDVDIAQHVTVDPGHLPILQMVHRNTSLDYSRSGNVVTYGQSDNNAIERDSVVQDAFGLFVETDTLKLKYKMGIITEAPNFGTQGWNAFFGMTDLYMGIPEPPDPEKIVKDGDEDWTTAYGQAHGVSNDRQFNTLGASETTYTYDVSQYVPNMRVMSQWHYNSFKLYDEVVDGLTIEEAYIVGDNASKFKVTVASDKKSVTAKAKEDKLQEADFYDKTYRLRIKVKVNRDTLMQYSGKKYSTKVNAPGSWSKESNGIYNENAKSERNKYEVLGWDADKTYIVVPNVAESEIDIFDKKSSNITRTFIEIPAPQDPVKTVKDADEGFKTASGDDNLFNTLEDGELTYTYRIGQRIPNIMKVDQIYPRRLFGESCSLEIF